MRALAHKLCKSYAASRRRKPPLFVLQLATMMISLKRWRRLKPRVQRHSLGANSGIISTEPGAKPTTIRVMAYDKDHVAEQKVDNPRALKEFVGKWPVVWVDVVGLGDEETLRAIAEVFRMHALAFEDVVHVHQRAKVDPYENGLYIVVRIPDESKVHVCEQFSLFLGKNFLVTFQEQPGDSFDVVRSSLKLKESTARQVAQPDYLAYKL